MIESVVIRLSERLHGKLLLVTKSLWAIEENLFINQNLSIMLTKNGIPSRKYYELLNWKDKNLSKFQDLHPGRSMNDLDRKELNTLYDAVIQPMKKSLQSVFLHLMKSLEGDIDIVEHKATINAVEDVKNILRI